MEYLIPIRVRSSLSKWSEDVPETYAKKLEEIQAAIETERGQWPRSADYMAPARALERLFEQSISGVPDTLKGSLKLALIARLALSTPKLLVRENLPKSILKFYPAAFERMESGINEKCSSREFSPFSRYARFVLAITVPCGAEAVDLNSCIPLPSALLSVYRMRSTKSLINYLGCKGFGTWFRRHTNTEYLEEFNEEGFDRFYLRIAELLMQRKDVRGLVGTSWFFDPYLSEISPRLAYLREKPMELGAFLMRHKASEIDAEHATKTSPTRRHLYQENRYTPTAYSLIWGREELLSWANSL